MPPGFRESRVGLLFLGVVERYDYPYLAGLFRREKLDQKVDLMSAKISNAMC